MNPKQTIPMKEVRNDRKTTLTHDFIPGHKYEVTVRAIGKDGQQQAMENSARNTVVMQGKLDSPSAPSELAATGYLNAISLTWTNPTNYDFSHVEIWRSSVNDIYTAAEIAITSGITHIDVVGAPNVTRYYWVRAVNTSQGASDYHPDTTAGVSGTTLGVVATDIDDFSITATKMFNNTIILNGDSWTDNYMGGPVIAWNAHVIVYQGSSHSIAAGNTTSQYVYWDGSSGSYSTAASQPDLSGGGFMIAVNRSGVHELVWNSSANMIIGSAWIMDAAITNAKIDNLAVTSAKVNDLSANKLTAGTIDASVINVTNIDAINITAGTLTGRRVQTDTGLVDHYKRQVLDVSDNTYRMYTDIDGVDTNILTIDDKLYGQYSGMEFNNPRGIIVKLYRNIDNYSYITHDYINIVSTQNLSSIFEAIIDNSHLNPASSIFKAKRTAGKTGKMYLATVGSTNVFYVDEAGNADFAGNITVDGNVDGVDVADHSTRHENGQADEISVADLSGELADDQPPKAHALTGTIHTGAGNIGNYVNINGSSVAQFRTPANVLSDIGGAASGANNDITSMTAVTEITLTPKASSTGAEGTIFYDSDDDHVYVATE